VIFRIPNDQFKEQSMSRLKLFFKIMLGVSIGALLMLLLFTWVTSLWFVIMGFFIVAMISLFSLAMKFAFWILLITAICALVYYVRKHHKTAD
jgi:hypothetical protein